MKDVHSNIEMMSVNKTIASVVHMWHVAPPGMNKQQQQQQLCVWTVYI